ncbi:MAG: trypsin-like peptidase domain-containing protein [Clostridiales bacterium]|nr:trypsin-like peptidase domain-containing protein [Clostridiales bacterium]
MEDYGRYEWNNNGEQSNAEGQGTDGGWNQNQPFQEFPPVNRKKPKNRKKAGWAKKVGAIALSAVLFGGVAGGVFTGVTYVTGAAAKGSVVSGTENQQNTGNTGNTGQGTTTLQTAASNSDGTADGQSLDVADIVDGAMPSIVSITNKSVQEMQQYYDMFGRSGFTPEQEVESRGSGFIVGENEEELLIVTNNHVVADATTLSVAFVDNQAYEAVIKGTDSENDLAVIAVKLSDLSEDTRSQIKVAQIGDSDALKVGQQVVAIGNALGYGQSVTTGIVSAKDRQVGDSQSENGFIQTDAAINPGNSGGALLNMNGEVIGINSAKLASTEVEGMGYAIPVNTASPIIEDLMNRETRTQVSADQAASLGIKAKNVDSSISEAYGIPQGVYVGEVTEGGAAQKAGLQPGSIITKFDKTSVKSFDELRTLLTYYAAGETVELTVKVADNGEYVEKTLEITLDQAQNTGK